MCSGSNTCVHFPYDEKNIIKDFGLLRQRGAILAPGTSFFNEIQLRYKNFDSRS